MIQKLPFEIVLAISEYLDFGNKLNLITTCRSMHDLISNTNLYSDLNLLKYKQTVDSIIEKFDSKLNGAQVKRLWIDANEVSDQFYDKLLTLFPNVTRLTEFTERSTNFSLENGELIHKYDNSPMEDWINTLETYILSEDGPALMPMLKCNTFPHLTELSLDLLCSPTMKNQGFDFLFVLPYIKNAPSLRKLTLKNYSISLELLEGIHSNCPYIEFLHLDQTAIVIREGASPQPMVPANSVTQLKISQSLIFDRNGLLLDYITRKYRNLQALILHFKTKYHLKQLKLYLKRRFEDSYSDAESDSDDEEDQSEETQNLYDILEQDFRLVAQVYQKKEPAFFSSLPRTIKTLELGTPFTENVLKELAKANIKPVALHLLKPTELYPWKLKDMEQLEYIREMKTLKSLKIDMDPTVQVLHLDFVSTSITKLYIRIENHPFFIDWVMEMFPSLEKLWVDCPDYSSAIKIVNRGAWKTNKTRIYPNLLTLKATYSPIDQKLLFFCKSAAPNVEKLDLTLDFPSKKKTVDIDLLGWNVKECNVSLPGFSPYEREYFIVQITIQDIKKRLVFQSLYGNMTLANSSVEPKIKRVVNITCSDNQRIVIGGFTLMKMGSKIMIDL